MKVIAAFLIGAALALPLAAPAEQNPDQEGVQQIIAQADLAWSRDELAEAEKLFLQAVEQATDGEPALRLGGFYLGQNRLGEAEERFQQAISAGLATPTLEARAFIGLGIAYLHHAQSSLAKAAFEEAVRIDPSRSDQVGQLLAQLEEREGGPPEH